MFLAGEDTLDVVELVQGLHGREVVDVDGENLIAYLAQHGVIELENGQLVARAAAGDIAQILGDGVVVAVVVLQLLEHLVGTFDDGGWHAGEFCDVDTEAVLTATLDQLTDKYHLAVDFLDAHVVVDDALEGLLHLVQLVVVGGEQRLGPRGVLVDVLDDAPGDGYAVVGARAASQLVEKDEAALAHVVEDGGCLGHLYHKGGLAQRDVVAGAHAGENLVHDADAGLLGGHETAHLRHQRDERRLAQQRRFTRHVGTSDNHDLLVIVAQADAVGHIGLARRQLALDDGMSAHGDVDVEAVVKHWAVVAVFHRYARQGVEAVELGDDGAIVLDSRDILGHGRYQFIEQAALDDEYFLLGTQDFFLIFLEFLCHIALGIDQRLLANPLLGHLVLVGVAHLDIVAEHVVVGNLQTRDARLLTQGALHRYQIVLAAARDVAQFVELGVDTTADDVATVGLVGGVGVDFTLDTVADDGAGVQLFAQAAQHVTGSL